MLAYATTHTHLLSISVILLALKTKSGTTFYSLRKDPMRNKALGCSQKCLVTKTSHHLSSHKCLDYCLTGAYLLREGKGLF